MKASESPDVAQIRREPPANAQVRRVRVCVWVGVCVRVRACVCACVRVRVSVPEHSVYVQPEVTPIVRATRPPPVCSATPPRPQANRGPGFKMSTTISAIYRESVSTVGPGELATSSAEKSDSDLYKVRVMGCGLWVDHLDPPYKPYLTPPLLHEGVSVCYGWTTWTPHISHI